MEITRDEFYRAVDSLKADLKEDIRGVHDRLDTLNGRTSKTEIVLEGLRVRVDSHETDMVRIRREDNEDAALALIRRRRNVREGQGEEWAEVAASTVTKREKALIGLGFVALSFALTLLQLLGTKLWELATVHKP